MFDGITAAMLGEVTAGITELLPVVIPTVITLIALRKGLSFLKSQIKGA